jgi:hypothetical protein
MTSQLIGSSVLALLGLGFLGAAVVPRAAHAGEPTTGRDILGGNAPAGSSWLTDEESEKSQRAFEAMLRMKKLAIAALTRAYDG